MKRSTSLFLAAAALAALSIAPAASSAGYPMISNLQNVQLPPGGATGVMHFYVTDDRTSADSLDVDASSGNQALVPDGNISLGGSGSDRTIQVSTTPGGSGIAIITVTVTDTDGESNEDTFEIETISVPNT